MSETLPLAGKVALVTGAARRIGAEIAMALHDVGMNIVLHYNTSEKDAISLCERLNQSRSQSAYVVQADLSQIDNAYAFMNEVASFWQRIDVLINNASRFYKTHLGEVTTDAWQDLMNCNLASPFFLAQAASSFLKVSKGCIINLIDIHAERPLRDYVVYCLSKAGLLMMTEVLAKEFGPDIRVNGVSPGSIIWPEGSNALSSEDKQKIINRTALARHGMPEDIAKAVLFLIKDADYITGQIIRVDGGRLLSG